MRDRILRDGILNHIREESGRSGGLFAAELATMTSIHSEANAEEEEKSATLWIILSLVTFGIAWLYVLYFLTRDPHRHDSRQQPFMQQVQMALSKLGKTVVVPSWKTIPSRSFFLYFILSILTLGLFEFYWYYVLIKDFNEHFKAQWSFEDQLAYAIG